MICCGGLRQVCGLWAHGHCAWIWPVRRPAESAPYLHHRQLRLASSAGILLVDDAADVARKDIPHLAKILQQGSESAAPGVDVQLPVRTTVWSLECAADSEGASTKQVRGPSVLHAKLLPSAKVPGRGGECDKVPMAGKAVAAPTAVSGPLKAVLQAACMCCRAVVGQISLPQRLDILQHGPMSPAGFSITILCDLPQCAVWTGSGLSSCCSRHLLAVPLGSCRR